jgi:hypothetical protein
VLHHFASVNAKGKSILQGILLSLTHALLRPQSDRMITSKSVYHAMLTALKHAARSWNKLYCSR